MAVAYLHPDTTGVPSPDEYDAVAQAVQRAFDDLEAITLRLRRVSVAYEDGKRIDPIPGLADVGALWAFVDDVNEHIEKVSEQRDELGRALDAMNLMRLDATAGRYSA